MQKLLVVAMNDVCSDESGTAASTVLDMEARTHRLWKVFENGEVSGLPARKMDGG